MKVRIVDHYRPGPRRLAILLACRCVVELPGGRLPQHYDCPEGHQPKVGRPRKSRVPVARRRLPTYHVPAKPVPPPPPRPARVYTDAELLAAVGSPNVEASLAAASMLAARVRSRRR